MSIQGSNTASRQTQISQGVCDLGETLESLESNLNTLIERLSGVSMPDGPSPCAPSGQTPNASDVMLCPYATTLRHMNRKAMDMRSRIADALRLLEV